MRLLDIITERTRRTAGTIPIAPGKREYPESAKTKRIGGEGSQGFAHQHPKDSNSIIKYADIYPPYEDDAYVQFVNMCQYHQDNPFFPRIKSAKIHEPRDEPDVRPGNMIIVMEKLFPVTELPQFKRAVESCEPNMNYIKKCHYMKQTSQKNAQNSTDVTFDEFVEWMFAEEGFIVLSNRNELKYAFNNKHFIEAHRLLDPLFHKFGNDMHHDNIMIRANGQCVILDPVFSE